MTTPLFVRSVYSLLSSMCSIEDIVLKCQEYGYKSCALVDKNVLSGAIKFKKACESNNIKPIYGLEVDANIFDRTHSCLLYAKDDEGYVNLMNLSSEIMTSEDKVISCETLNKYKAHNVLVFLSDDMPLTHIIDKKLDEKECLTKMIELFGNDFLVGLTDHDININVHRDMRLKEILKENKIRTLAISRTFYIDRDDNYEYEVLKCIRDKRTIEDKNNLETGRHFLNNDEYSSMYEELDLKNNDVLASICNVKMNFKTDLPIYKAPNGMPAKEYLVSLSKEGLRRRLHGNVTKEYINRLEYELGIIIKMNFENYFLIVYDYILYAKKNDILVAPGRGSAAGSLVAYCLGITDIDPIKYGLLFERFLNPERISMPDIDTDFQDDRRDEVIEYVKNKYGIDHVAHIITYGTLKAKQVLRDVGRVLKYQPRDLDSITKLIPNHPPMSLKQAYESTPLFKQKVDSEKKYKDLYLISSKLEGFPRHESTHAAGVVFSREKLSNIAPVIKIENDVNSTQYTMEYLEELGLIKMDFLSIRNLSIIVEIVTNIKKNIDPNFDIRKIPLDDKKTFALIDNVNLLGVFQLESEGMQNLARKMKPKSFAEIGMMIALFRPGPMQNIPTFLDNRANPSKIKYLVPALKPILEETYGIIVYQEQNMKIARVLAGFSYGKADVLRRAMSKKKKEELLKLKDEFIDGCINNGYEKEMAEELYQLIFRFADYGFNKPHSIAYAMVAYQMAYLKANYPLYFYKALLNGVIGAENKTYDYIKECLNINQIVKGVDINDSGVQYEIKDNSIIMPFTIIKDLGSISANKIIEERSKGPFNNYVECVCRLVNNGVERNVIENLISSGAFDRFDYSRFSMSSSLENVLRYASTHKQDLRIFDESDDYPLIDDVKDNKTVMAEKEKEVLGFYFSYNPILEYKKQHNITCLSLLDLSMKKGEVNGFGVIRRIKEHRTKNNELMAFLDIIDDTGKMSLALMPRTYSKYQPIIKKDTYIEFIGKIEKEDSILVSFIKEA